MAQESKVVRFSDRKSVDRFSLPPVLVRLRDTSGQALKSVLSDAFDKADDALFELADRASTNVDQTAYFDAMRELRLRRKSMVLSVLQYVSRAFNDLGRFTPRDSGGSLDALDQDSLSLVDHDELEQQVAVDNLVNKLRNRHAETIRLLTVRVRHLVPDIALEDSQMPLSPEVICGGIGEACADLDIDIRAKLVVLKLFDRLLVDTLGGFYQDANRTLVAEGVLPDMKRPPVPRAGGLGSPRSPGATPGHSTGASAGADDAAHTGRHPTFSELSALLHQGGVAGPGVSAASSPGAAVLDTDALMVRLNDIQSQAVGWEADQVVPLRQQLGPVLQNEGGQSLQVGQVDSDVINLVSMLFDFILEDRQLHPVMKALIGRLQIPVLKVALSDKNFFNRGGHPVRKLLNELALSAIGWSEKKAGQRDPLKDKIESVVERVLHEFTDNVELFDELLKDFSHFMDLDRRRRELVEQRLRDAEEGRARQEQASEMARGVIADLTTDRDIPEPVRSLLDEAWNRYLQWVHLREGEDSERWAEARALTEKLVWSVDPRPVTEHTRTDLLRAIPAIVDDLRKALQEISWDPFATDSAIRDLELAHVDVFQRLVTTAPAAPDPEPDITLPEEPPQALAEPETTPEDSPGGETAQTEPVANKSVATEPVAEAAPQPQPDAAEAGASPTPAIAPEWLERADSLRVGSWIELTRDDSKVRCKLAAFIKATGKYIFVNRSGSKVAEYQREQLAEALAAGDITMLDDGLIFDRALESIIDNLRNSRKD